MPLPSCVSVSCLRHQPCPIAFLPLVYPNCPLTCGWAGALAILQQGLMLKASAAVVAALLCPVSWHSWYAPLPSHLWWGRRPCHPASGLLSWSGRTSHRSQSGKRGPCNKACMTVGQVSNFRLVCMGFVHGALHLHSLLAHETETARIASCAEANKRTDCGRVSHACKLNNVVMSPAGEPAQDSTFVHQEAQPSTGLRSSRCS